MRNTSLTFRQAVNAQETGEAFIILVEISTGAAEPIRISSDGVNTVHDGNTYYAWPFDIVLPDDPESGAARARIAVDNVSRELVAWLRGLSSVPQVTIKVVLASDPETIEAEFPNFELRNAQYDAMTIQGDLTLATFMNEPYPGDSFLPSTFPGVF